MGKSKKKCASVEAHRRNRMKAVPIAKKNPFEVCVVRSKHDILGKKSKSDKGLPGVSRSKAIEKRKTTLLKEYKQRDKTNMMVDKRFGEYNENMSAEEKMLKRFTLEKLQHHQKSSLYNLNDGEDDILTHFGQSLSEIDNFDDAGLNLSDDDDTKVDQDEHFGGFLTKKKDLPESSEKSTDGPRSKQDIMDEVVANAKKKKFDRQQVQEEAFKLTQMIDGEFKSIQSLLLKKDDRKVDAPPQKTDDYDKKFRELTFDIRATATDRLKSDEEIAREEKKRVEKLELEKFARMKGEKEGEEDKVFQSADALINSGGKKRDNRFEVHYKDGKMVLPDGMSLFPSSKSDGNTEIDAANDNSEDGNGSDADDNDEDDDEDDEDDNDVNDSADSDVDVDNEGIVDDVNETDSESDMDGTDNGDNIDVKHFNTIPSKLEDLILECKEKSFEEQSRLFSSIKKSHSINVDIGNRLKLETFFCVVIDYIDWLCQQETVPMKFINSLGSFLFEISLDIKSSCHKIIKKRLKKIFKNIVMRSKVKGSSGWFPSLKELVFFKIVANIFHTSDLKHPITTPTLYLMLLILHKAHFTSTKDVIAGLFLLDVVFNYISDSRRFLPEVFRFMAKILYQGASTSTPIEACAAGMLNLRKEEANYLLIDENQSELLPHINIASTLTLNAGDPDISCRLACIKNTLLICKKFSTLYTDISCYHEVFYSLVCLVKRLPISNYPESFKGLHTEVVVLLTAKLSQCRTPLIYQKRKPIPLPLFEPQFEENYEVVSKRRAGNKAQNEREKLKYKLKKEQKSVVREIRKDASFLAKEQLRETIAKDSDRKRKVKELEHALATERSDIKQMERGSKKKK